jgi:hypothetical protein
VTARPFLILFLTVAPAAVAVACGSSSGHRLPAQTTASPVLALAGGGPRHVAVIVMENEEYGGIIGNPSAPFINALARRYALAGRAFAITHPSLPNYLALTGGSTFGITSDCTDCSVPGAGLAGQLDRAGISWKAYMEGMPSPCFTGPEAGRYAKKHDPFVYYRAVVGDPAACRRVVPLRELAADTGARRLPRFVWITPDLCHDMHDCSTTVGDAYLASLVPGVIRALGPRGVLFLVWDEGTSDDGCCRVAAGGHIALVVAGGLARRGARLATPVDHYSVLQAVEDLFGLPRLHGAACACTPSLAPLLRRGAG